MPCIFAFTFGSQRCNSAGVVGSPHPTSRISRVQGCTSCSYQRITDLASPTSFDRNAHIEAACSCALKPQFSTHSVVHSSSVSRDLLECSNNAMSTTSSAVKRFLLSAHKFDYDIQIVPVVAWLVQYIYLYPSTPGNRCVQDPSTDRDKDM